MSPFVNVQNVTVLDNPARFKNPLQVAQDFGVRAHAASFTCCLPCPQFEVSFECLTPMTEDIE